ncbi:MAG: ankyrin repeat domain-containing protein, partial [Armatimonadetes bacterium]|nr:ankyrin repeat domain-containing protein [Armatimonadota bacterium]
RATMLLNLTHRLTLNHYLIAFILLAFLALALLSARQAIWELYLSADVYNAVEAGNASKVEALLKKGANPNRIGAGGLVGGTPLTWATEKSDLKIMKALIRGGADVNKRIGRDFTALMLAPTPQAAQLLLDAGANPRLQNEDGQTALQFAQEMKLSQVVKVLLRAETKHKNP